MKSKIPPSFTIEDLGARFGAQIAQLYARIIVLESENQLLISEKAEIERKLLAISDAPIEEHQGHPAP